MKKARTLAAIGCIAAFALSGGPSAQAQEDVSVAIISFSPYAPWYIVKDKGLAKDVNLDIKIIEGIAEKNAAITSGQVQCMNNTMDSMVLARAGDLPIKVVAFSNMSYGLDKMVVTEDIKSVEDFKGRKFGADYGFLNHMWMLLTLKRAGIGFDELTHVTMLPQESAAAFASGGIDMDVNYDPFAAQSLERQGSYVFKSSLTDRTWERGLISDAIACNEDWLKEKPEAAKELFRAWFEAVNWWKENPDQGNDIIAKGLDWPLSDVRLNQHGAVMLNLEQNLGAFGIGGNRPLCQSLPDEAPRAPADAKGWGALFNGEDCIAGYAAPTWELFNDVYVEAGVSQKKAASADGLDSSILEALAAEGYVEKYSSNKWTGRVGL
jgi:NitT/TauT family transport system substrate-binding protein